jgi:DNA uptake protein ComE-like DNA-binding protein
MPEDAGKKRFIKDFLQQVKAGAGFVEDIRIERVVRPPSSDGKGSTARSLSGRQISNITQLLEDDLSHTFDEGYFTFRFVAALVGSGKTSLLTYLQELTKTKPTYQSHSVVVPFQLSDISLGNGFLVKLYCHILADTFWGLLHNSNLSISVRNITEQILGEFLDNSQVAQLKASNKLMPFRNKFKKYIVESVDSFEEFFFYVIDEVSSVDPKFSFVYLTDELDALEDFPDEIQETRLLFKELIRRAFQQFKSKIRLLIYLVGTSGNVGSFISGDSVIESLVGDLVINLNKGYSNEFEMIRAKIDERIKGAFQGYKDFDKAWQEIQNIQLNPANTLREFCRDYASAVLEIHEKYFKEEPEKSFEGDARQLVEAQCKQKWANYLNKKTYSLSAVSTTTVLAGHAFDGYVELLHNGNCVARAFGEAKNYELLSGHLETFKQWLEDVNFNPSAPDGTPPDLAFMIAPSCPSLLQRKLELKNIQFIKSDKKTNATPVGINESTVTVDIDEPSTGTEDSTESSQTSSSTSNPNWVFSKAININKADKNQLIYALKGTGIKRTTIDRLINNRQDEIYKNLDNLVSSLNFTPAVKAKLEKKLKDGEICF